MGRRQAVVQGVERVKHEASSVVRSMTLPGHVWKGKTMNHKLFLMGR